MLCFLDRLFYLCQHIVSACAVLNGLCSSFSIYCLKARFTGIMAAFDNIVVNNSGIMKVLKMTFCL